MFNTHKTIKINLKGGIVSPSWLLSVLAIVEKAALESIRFGARQQLTYSNLSQDLWGMHSF